MHEVYYDQKQSSIYFVWMTDRESASCSFINLHIQLNLLGACHVYICFNVLVNCIFYWFLCLIIVSNIQFPFIELIEKKDICRIFHVHVGWLNIGIHYDFVCQVTWVSGKIDCNVAFTLSVGMNVILYLILVFLMYFYIIENLHRNSRLWLRLWIFNKYHSQRRTRLEAAAHYDFSSGHFRDKNK